MAAHPLTLTWDDGLLINAIAAAVLGGTSLFGGRGSTWSALLGVEPAVQFVTTGGVLLTAVLFDSLARRAAESGGPRARTLAKGSVSKLIVLTDGPS